MTFAARQQDTSHTTIFLVEIDLDFCDRTFGVSPCLATGAACYNTLPTCKYTTAYQNTTGRTYRFTNEDAPAPFNTGERPYVRSVRLNPTEIGESLTLPGRVTIEFADEPDDDVGVDPYVSTRSSVQGTFWKKLLARNPNFKGRQVRVYEGYLGDPIGEFHERFRGKIQEFRVSRGSVSIDVADKVVDLTEIEIPAKLEIELRLAMGISDTWANLTTLDGLDSPSGYVRIEDEILSYSSVDAGAFQLQGMTRAVAGTVAVAHDEGDKVGRVRYYAPNRPSNIIGLILTTDLGLGASDYDATGLLNLWTEPDLEIPKAEAYITEPTKASDLIFELLELADAYMWVGEDLKLTFARRTPNAGGRAYALLSDAESVIKDSASVNLMDEERRTRVVLYWHKNPVGDDDEDKVNYKRIAVAVDQDLEGADWFGEVEEYPIYSRWLREGSEVPTEVHEAKITSWLKRKLARVRLARAQLEIEVARKDSDVGTGNFVRLSTDEMVDRHGNPLVSVRCQVMRREDLGDKIRLTLRRLATCRIGLWAPGTVAADYDDADEDDREYAYWANDPPNEGHMNNDDLGYYWA